MLATYTMFGRGNDDKEGMAFLMRWNWCYLVADEAHALKNRSSIRTRKLRRVAAGCEHRLLITGTPLQNSLEELRALLEFLMPSLFGSGDGDDDPSGEEEQAAAIERYKALLAPFILRRLKSEVATQLAKKAQMVKGLDMTEEQQSEVATQLAKKAQVLKGLDMTEEQQGRVAALYRKAVESMRKEVAEASKVAARAAAEEGRKPARRRPKGSTNMTKAQADAEKSASNAFGSANKTKAQETTDPMEGRPKGSTNKAKAQADAEMSASDGIVGKLSSQRVSNIFTHLRKVAQHPLLVRNRFSDEDLLDIAKIASENGLYAGNCSFDRVHKELLDYNDHALHRFAATYPNYLEKYVLPSSCLMSSTKMRYLKELLPELRSAGSRVLLFSQWTSVLDIMEWFMELQGFTFVRLDGDTVVEERLKLVDKFNDPANGVDIFLLSTRAGGQGLNLTGADVVVLHDVDFNPQVDRQAEDRCHRLGQTKPTVYRPMTKTRPMVYRPVTETNPTVHRHTTVDENILSIADRKLALDAAVLEGFTLSSNGDADEGAGAGGSKKGGAKKEGGETRYMGAILASLLADA
eukprot:gene7107-211_t